MFYNTQIDGYYKHNHDLCIGINQKGIVMIFADLEEDVLVSKRTKEKNVDCVKSVSFKRTSKSHVMKETTTYQSHEILDINEYEVC